MPLMSSTLIVLIFSFLMVCSFASQALGDKHVKVLGIGNSFTVNANTFRESLNNPNA